MGRLQRKQSPSITRVSNNAIYDFSYADGGSVGISVLCGFKNAGNGIWRGRAITGPIEAILRLPKYETWKGERIETYILIFWVKRTLVKRKRLEHSFHFTHKWIKNIFLTG